MWEGQLSILPESTLSPTLYPLGESMQAWARRVLEVASEDPLVVVGCSMGGSCALEMARQAPARIAALVLVGANASHRPEPSVRDRYIASMRDGGIGAVWPELESHVFGPTADPAVVKRAMALAMRQDVEDVILATRVFHSRPDAVDVVANWEKPLTVIVGDCDGFVSVEKSRRLATTAPQGELHILPKCGHFVNLERPTEFNRIVGEVVQRAGVTA